MTVADDSIAPAPLAAEPPRTLTRRQMFKRAAMLAVVPAAAGVYATQIEPFWPRFPQMTIRVRALPAAFEGFRIAQVTDMHSGYADFGYLTRTLRRVATTFKPDLVLATGDMIHHTREWAEPVARLFRETFIDAGIPVVASFGNHEFGYARRPGEPADNDLHLAVEAALSAHGTVVLRNRSHALERGGSRLWTVGLDDLWFGRFDPDAAFDGVSRDEPRIALSHNPDTAPFLDPFAPDLILSGHTHGGQVRLPGLGAPVLNVADTRHDWGLFNLPNSQLYVSSGIGYIRRIRFGCRPEVPVFTLMRA